MAGTYSQRPALILFSANYDQNDPTVGVGLAHSLGKGLGVRLGLWIQRLGEARSRARLGYVQDHAYRGVVSMQPQTVLQTTAPLSQHL